MKCIYLEIPELPATEAPVIALAAERLVVLAGKRLQLFSISRSEVQLQTTIDLQLCWEPTRVELSPSGRHVLLRGSEGKHVALWSLDHEALVTEMGSADVRPQSVVAGFVGTPQRELLIATHRPYELEGTLIHDLVPVFRADCSSLAFAPSSIHTLAGDGDLFCVIGHLFSDPLDALVTLSVAELQRDGGAVERELKAATRVNDRAYRLAVGPCDRGAIAVFRDPEDDEEPDPDDLEPLGDVENFRGLYIRSLGDQRLVQRIEYNAPLASGAGLLATDSHIAVVSPAQLDLVSRSTARSERLIAGIAFALDPRHGRVAMLVGHSRVEVVQL